MYDNTDSLTSYLRQIGDLEPLSTLEQQRLCKDIEKATSALRIHSYRFGFVATEHLHLLDACINSGNAPADYFLPSSLKPSSAKDFSMLPALVNYRKNIESKFAVLNQLFHAGQSCDGAKNELVSALSEFTINTSTLWEYLDVVENYVRIVQADFGTQKHWKFHLPSTETNQLKLLRDKFLMRNEELEDEINTLFVYREELQKLRIQMVETNLRLVISIAQKYRNRHIPFNDLIQEGNLGLLRALDRFDFNLGYKFSTYASWWIKHNISQIITEQSRVIRLPAHMVQSIRNIHMAEQRFIQLHGQEPTNQDIADMLELPVARVSAIRKMACQTISLQAPAKNDDNGTLLEDLLADTTSSNAPAQEYAREILYERLHAMLRTLPEREQQIIIMRFGFFGQKCMPLADISRRFNLTRERVRQLEIKILESLRTPEKMKFIDNCYHPES